MNIGFISLGCVKNQVDSEIVLSYLKRNSFNIIDNPHNSDIIIINTCGFIEESKQEAIDTILEMLSYKKTTIVIGCLVERYMQELQIEMPEVDLFIPVRDYERFGDIFQKLIVDKKLEGKLDLLSRSYLTPDYQAYLKISDGCDNRCTYCAIPLIRGGFKSVPLSTLKIAISDLAKKGVKELIIISQDTTRYGSDFNNKTTICDVLKEALKYESFVFIRLLYLYPDEITDELIDLFATSPRLTPYFDIPLQHASNKLLLKMHRRGSKEEIVTVINKIRNKVPHAILRTTIIVGFPGETEDDFAELLDFVAEIKFDHLGAFTYSREEDTESYDYEDQIDEKIKNRRKKELMKLQAKISYSLNKNRIGDEEIAIVTDFDDKNFVYIARSKLYAPDDIDGKIFLYSAIPLDIGDVVNIKIEKASVYDLEAIVTSEII